MSKFNADQQLAYDLANLNRRGSGLPDWIPDEFAVANPMKFRGPDDAPPYEADQTALPAPPLGSRRSRAAEAKGE